MSHILVDSFSELSNYLKEMQQFFIRICLYVISLKVD